MMTMTMTTSRRSNEDLNDDESDARREKPCPYFSPRPWYTRTICPLASAKIRIFLESFPPSRRPRCPISVNSLVLFLSLSLVFFFSSLFLSFFFSLSLSLSRYYRTTHGKWQPYYTPGRPMLANSRTDTHYLTGLLRKLRSASVTARPRRARSSLPAVSEVTRTVMHYRWPSPRQIRGKKRSPIRIVVYDATPRTFCNWPCIALASLYAIDQRTRAILRSVARWR